MAVYPGFSQQGLDWVPVWYMRGCPGDSIGFSVRYQGELLGTWDTQNRDPRRNLPSETKFSVDDYHPSGMRGVNERTPYIKLPYIKI